MMLIFPSEILKPLTFLRKHASKYLICTWRPWWFLLKCTRFNGFSSSSFPEWFWRRPSCKSTNSLNIGPIEVFLSPAARKTYFNVFLGLQTEGKREVVKRRSDFQNQVNIVLWASPLEWWVENKCDKFCVLDYLGWRISVHPITSFTFPWTTSEWKNGEYVTWANILI